MNSEILIYQNQSDGSIAGKHKILKYV